MNYENPSMHSGILRETDLDQLRRLGLDGVDDVPWGAHLCQFYDTGADLLETLVPYFKAGLESNEFCMWVTSEPLGKAEAFAALRRAVPELKEFLTKGQIEILDYREWYKSTGRFDAKRVHQGWIDKLDAALKRGFDGLRLTGDTGWLTDNEWEHFIRYEARLDPVIASSRILAICSYALKKCGTRGLLDAVANHDFALIKERGRWEAFKSFSRRRTEGALRESETRLRLTVEGVSDGIVTLDQNGSITLVNSAVSRMFGYAPSELIGKSIAFLMRRNWNGVQNSHFTKYLEHRKEFFIGRTHQGEAVREDGSRFPLEWTVTEIFFDHQPYFVLCMRDLTEQRQKEALLQQLHADRLVSMGGMASALAHEINQPLTATVAYLNSVQRLLRVPADQHTTNIDVALGKAAEQALRAGKIVTHMREFIARNEPDKTVQNLHEVVLAACDLTLATAKNTNVRIILNLNAESDRILIDKIQITQVLVNLIRNAIEAMHASSVRELTISTSSTGDGAIRIDVADTGGGLCEEARTQLFQPFKTSKANGMGVGLSISRSIIEAHYGEIWAEPNPAGGAVFSFTLPSHEGE
jgi:two-component system sensor kinase FixL